MLTLEQKYLALLVLGQYGYQMDHYLMCKDDEFFLTPAWLERYHGDPLESYVKLDLMDKAGYRPEWFATDVQNHLDRSKVFIHDTTQTLDPDGMWRKSIPLPFYSYMFSWRFPFLRKAHMCMDCKTKFSSEKAYQDHYRSDHPF